MNNTIELYFKYQIKMKSYPGKDLQLKTFKSLHINNIWNYWTEILVAMLCVAKNDSKNTVKQ